MGVYKTGMPPLVYTGQQTSGCSDSLLFCVTDNSMGYGS